jgi:alkylation response protein AidB-like acyl-CoA dehydrogenase
MDLAFTDEQQFLRESVRGTIEREAPLARVREWVLGERVEHADALAMAVRQGWTGIGIADECGGQGGGVLELSILAQELGRGAVPADGLYATLLTEIALVRCSDVAARGSLESFATGEAFAALAAPGGLPLDAAPAGGELALVLGAQHADTIFAWDGGSLELYDRASAGVTPRRLVDRTRAFADVSLPGEPRLRLGGLDAEGMREVAAAAAVMVAADALGAAERMLELTVEYVGQRVQFGVPVGSFQAVKHSTAEMLVGIEGTRAAVQYAAWAVGAEEPGRHVDAWVAKSRASRVASEVADKALFLHGAVGYTWEHDLQLLFKRAKSDSELFGSAGAYEDRIADSLDLAPAERFTLTR